MDAYDLVIEEINTKHNNLQEKLSSGSIQNYSEYRYVCGVINGLNGIKEYLEDLQKRFNEDD
jgi:hypothetical protein|tara:strand:+ start:1211 stop:1396 length:186 start_codon:yes stop_codon:yes gene_type:complete